LFAVQTSLCGQVAVARSRVVPPDCPSRAVLQAIHWRGLQKFGFVPHFSWQRPEFGFLRKYKCVVVESTTCSGAIFIRVGDWPPVIRCFELREARISAHQSGPPDFGLRPPHVLYRWTKGLRFMPAPEPRLVYTTHCWVRPGASPNPFSKNTKQSHFRRQCEEKKILTPPLTNSFSNPKTGPHCSNRKLKTKLLLTPPQAHDLIIIHLRE
jgi:hypothetical protein